MYTDDLAGKLDQFWGRTIHVPSSVNYFEFNGENKTFGNFSIVSDARKTVLNKTKFANCGHLPLRISSTDVVLNQVDVTAKGTGIALTADHANLALQSTINVNTGYERSMIAKSVTLSASKEDIVGTLAVSDELDYCGSVNGSSHLANGGNELMSISSETFEAVLNGVLVTLNANGGQCDVEYILVESGQPAQLPTATRMGYLFDGWYLSDGTQLTSANAASFGNSLTATAWWTSAAYTSAWEAGTGAVITVNRTASYVNTAALGELSPGDTVYYGDTLSVTYEAQTGFTITDHGEEAITVTGNVTASTIFATAAPNAYKVNWSNAANCTIAVKRTSSPYKGAATGTLSKNADIYYGDVLTVTYTPAANYRLKSSGASPITVTGNVTSSHIYATAELNTKLVKISNYNVGSVRSHLEIYTVNGIEGMLYLKGWLYDTSNTGAQLRIDVDSQYSIPADQANSACPVGGNHGYEATVTNRGARVMIHTWAAGGGNPIKIWDMWIDYANSTYYAVELAP